MYWDIVDVKLENEPLSLSVKFLDGTNGKVVFKPESLYGVFEPLKNPQFFAQVFIDDGVVAWPGEIDLAPDSMHEDIKKYGKCVI